MLNLVRYIETEEYTQIVILSMLRRIVGIRVEDAATAVGVSKGMLSMIESGKREVSIEQIKKYSDYLQDSLKLKTNLYNVLLEQSKEHKVTDIKDKDSPLDFFFAYLKRCVETN